jgi:hypothetical protein
MFCKRQQAEEGEYLCMFCKDSKERRENICACSVKTARRGKCLCMFCKYSTKLENIFACFVKTARSSRISLHVQ